MLYCLSSPGSTNIAIFGLPAGAEVAVGMGEGAAAIVGPTDAAPRTYKHIEVNRCAVHPPKKHVINTHVSTVDSAQPTSALCLICE